MREKRWIRNDWISLDHLFRYLSVQIVDLHLVVVHNTDTTHAGSCQVRGARTSKPSGADDQNRSPFQLQLSLDMDFWEDYLATVPVGVRFN